MWIEIRPDVFDGGTDIDQLRKLIQDLCYKHRYNVYIDIIQIQDNDVFESFYDSNNEILSEYFNSFITERKPISYKVTNIIEDSSCFNVSDGIKFFNSPLMIILENSDNDGYFIDAILREFKTKSKTIKRFKAENWVRYAMGGGSDNIIHYVEAEKRHFNGDIRFLKFFVLIDSDLEYPHTPNTKRRRLEDYFNQNSIPYHILEKREIENYLPDNLLGAIDIENRFVKSYLDLSSQQKDYIDIEKGFQSNQNNIQQNKPLVYNLYSNLTSQGFDNLRVGLKDEFQNFKNEYPKLFAMATQDGLIERTKEQQNPKELQDILDKINKML